MPILEENKRYSCNEFDQDQTLYINAYPVLKKPMCVQTTNQNIIKAVELFSKQLSKSTQQNTYRRLVNKILDTDTDKVFEESKRLRNDDFSHLCDDVFDIMILRFILYNKEIPVNTSLPDESEGIHDRKK